MKVVDILAMFVGIFLSIQRFNKFKNQFKLRSKFLPLGFSKFVLVLIL